ncbi:hypothetical protein NQ318_000055 [Aromia moschata]|uniref:Uncharacterized protein n=1 Tax=Aromia moschata TaxID=1265417 RepID=A0AAV8YBQ4_9CUCU|nr:hypothetical protein NQ318_000055 [Aromia moschata]
MGLPFVTVLVTQSRSLFRRHGFVNSARVTIQRCLGEELRSALWALRAHRGPQQKHPLGQGDVGTHVLQDFYPAGPQAVEKLGDYGTSGLLHAEDLVVLLDVRRVVQCPYRLEALRVQCDGIIVVHAMCFILGVESNSVLPDWSRILR